jgi:hypothetical protein
VRDYGRVHTTFWSSDTLGPLSDDARYVALYLLTCPHGHMAGVFRLPLAYAVDDTGWTIDRLRGALIELASADWLARDEKSGWTWIKKFLQWNKPDNPNMWKAVAKQCACLPDTVSFKTDCETVSKGFHNGLGNLPVPVPVPVPADAGASFVLDDGTEFIPPADLLAELRAAFPRLDLAAELAKVRAWCAANPSMRKTRRGAAKFLNGWLNRANDRLPPPSATPPPAGGRRKLQ